MLLRRRWCVPRGLDAWVCCTLVFFGAFCTRSWSWTRSKMTFWGQIQSIFCVCMENVRIWRLKVLVLDDITNILCQFTFHHNQLFLSCVMMITCDYGIWQSERLSPVTICQTNWKSCQSISAIVSPMPYHHHHDHRTRESHMVSCQTILYLTISHDNLRWGWYGHLTISLMVICQNISHDNLSDLPDYLPRESARLSSN